MVDALWGRRINEVAIDGYLGFESVTLTLDDGDVVTFRGFAQYEDPGLEIALGDDDSQA